MKLTRPWILLLLSSSVAGAVAIACGGDDTTAITPSPDGGTTDGGSTTDGASPGDDGATTDDGGTEEVTDGGDNPPENDGGLNDLDSGFDAGPACGDPLQMGGTHQSTCATVGSRLNGGTLVSGTFYLTGVVSYGGLQFCADGGRYIAYDHRGVLIVDANDAGTSATFEFQELYQRSNGIANVQRQRYDVTVTALGTALSFTAKDCQDTPAPAGAPQFAAGTNRGGKKYITLRYLTGRTGYSDYTFVAQ